MKGLNSQNYKLMERTKLKVVAQDMLNAAFFPKRQISDSAKLKEFADDNVEFDENGKNFSRMVENTQRKTENAYYEQFFLFSQFSKDCTADM